MDTRIIIAERIKYRNAAIYLKKKRNSSETTTASQVSYENPTTGPQPLAHQRVSYLIKRLWPGDLWPVAIDRNDPRSIPAKKTKATEGVQTKFTGIKL